MARTRFDLAKRSCVLVLLAALGACQAADGTSQAPDVALVDSIMRGLGAVDPKEKPIEYKPRAPLAMPSETASLPEPETKVAGTQTADWPEQRENEQLTEIKRLYTESGDQDERLTPEQMRGFTITGVTGQRQRDIAGERRDTELGEGGTLTRAEQQAEWERLQKLRAEKAGIDNENVASRRYLIEPPSTYSTPSADAPMPEIVKKTKKVEKDRYSTAPLDPRCLEGEEQYCR